jgi:hypothetical protein
MSNRPTIKYNMLKRTEGIGDRITELNCACHICNKLIKYTEDSIHLEVGSPIQDEWGKIDGPLTMHKECWRAFSRIGGRELRTEEDMQIVLIKLFKTLTKCPEALYTRVQQAKFIALIKAACTLYDGTDYRIEISEAELKIYDADKNLIYIYDRAECKIQSAGNRMVIAKEASVLALDIEGELRKPVYRASEIPDEIRRHPRVSVFTKGIGILEMACLRIEDDIRRRIKAVKVYERYIKEIELANIYKLSNKKLRAVLMAGFPLESWAKIGEGYTVYRNYGEIGYNTERDDRLHKAECVLCKKSFMDTDGDALGILLERDCASKDYKPNLMESLMIIDQELEQTPVYDSNLLTLAHKGCLEQVERILNYGRKVISAVLFEIIQPSEDRRAKLGLMGINIEAILSTIEPADDLIPF